MPGHINKPDSNSSDSREGERAQILETTEHLLEEHGPGALSVRRIAERSDVSTQMIYTLFGGKSGLLKALYMRGFDRLASYLDEVPEDPSPESRLAELGRAYRRFALENSMLYQVMTGGIRPEFEPPSAAQERDTRAFELLENCIRDYISAGIYRSGLHPREVADVHWAMVHGAVGLEISGFYDASDVAEARFEAALTAVSEQFRANT